MICDRAKKIDIRHYKGGTYPIVTLANGYVIEVVTTPCHFGGERFWFLCPRCGRRCAVLYPLACRICMKGHYASEHMSPADRLTRKAYKIRERLGQRRGSLFEEFPPKPKGMHWSTYERLVAQGEAVEEQILEGAPFLV